MKKSKKIKSLGKERIESLSNFYRKMFSAKEISGVTSTRARAFFNSRLTKFFIAALKVITQASTRFFGFMFLSCGLITLAIRLGGYYLGFFGAIDYVTVIISAVFLLFSLPLLIIDRPTNLFFQDFPLTDFLFFEFFAINRTQKNDAPIMIPPVVGLFVGIIPTVCGYFFSLLNVVLVLVSVAVIALGMVSPEFPILLSLVLLPYLNVIPASSVILVALSVLAFVSFFRKVLVGKRVYSLEMQDVLLVIFAALFAVSAFLDGTYESKERALMLVSTLFAYIPISNMIMNRRLAVSTVNAIVVSGIPLAVVAIIDYVKAIIADGHIPSSSFFDFPYELAAFLLSLLIFTTFLAIEQQGKVKKAAYMSLLGLYFSAAITTECVPLIIVFLLSLVAYAIIKSLALPRELLVIIALLPLAIFFLPDSVLERISSLFFAMPDLLGMKADLLASLSVFRENIFFGVGPDGAYGAGTVAESNLLIGMAAELGIFALIAFLVMLMFRMRHFSIQSIYRTASNVSRFITMGSLSAFAIIALGSFYNVFSSVAVFYLFFASVAIAAASIRISKREYDDRLSYYGDQSSIDSSAVDVILRSR